MMYFPTNWGEEPQNLPNHRVVGLGNVFEGCSTIV